MGREDVGIIMKSILVKTNLQGVVLKTYFDDFDWMHDKIRTIFHLLDSFDKAALQSDQVLVQSHTIHDTDVSVIVYPSGQLKLICIFDVLCEEKNESFILRLLHIISEIKDDVLIKEDNMHKGYYEEIQKLNLELSNQAREIVKLNHQLQEYNQILTQRLVKDPLTQLVSRYQYRDEMLYAIQSYPEQQGLFAFVDIDDFKKINDTYGHQVGDQYLVIFARRMSQLPFKAVIMRIAGDEFGFFRYGMTDVSDTTIETIWKEIETICIDTIQIGTLELPLSISVGFARYPIDTDDIHLLIDYADYAMYEAKKSGKNQFAVFDKQRYLQNKKN